MQSILISISGTMSDVTRHSPSTCVPLNLGLRPHLHYYTEISHTACGLIYLAQNEQAEVGSASGWFRTAVLL